MVLGFSGLLVCIIGAGVFTVLVLDRVRDQETRSRKAFLERLGMLSQIREQIYLSGTYARDLLLSPDPTASAAQAFRLTALERETEAALETYSHSLQGSEQAPFAELRREIGAYWRVLDATLAWSPAQRNRLRSAFFYNELVPRRTSMLQIADRIAAVNEQGLDGAEEQLAKSAAGLRRSLILTFALTLAGGLVLALATTGHTIRLERELEERRADLQDLSSRLLRAQENERRSVARELHDEVGQSLSAIMIEAEGAECAVEPAELQQHLTSVRSLAEKCVNQVRDMALLLRPSMLDDLGLTPALDWHARETYKRTGLRVAVSADEGADGLPEEQKTCIYRLVQEAVNNAARHAGARAVDVAVRREKNRVTLTVQDDGAGFDARIVRGLGLLGMEERVRRLGGRLRVDSQPGQGTRITAALPLVELTGGNGDHGNSRSAG